MLLPVNLSSIIIAIPHIVKVSIVVLNLRIAKQHRGHRRRYQLFL